MIRYPGSKDKISELIMSFFPHSMMDPLFHPRQIEYREPFFGAGAVGMALLRRLPCRSSIWLNDKDFGMACLWKSVHQDHKLLIDRIRSFVPTTEAFYKFKAEDSVEDMSPVEIGFRKFALHQLSFGGLGVRAGGPIGGRRQLSEFNVDCRWNAIRHCGDVEENHLLLKQFDEVKITSGDFQKLIDNAPSHAFIYADPPYYEKGPELYKHSMSDDDHRRLANSLRACTSSWVLSYDGHQFIRDLYAWAKASDINLTYTTAVAKTVRRRNSEVIITPPSVRS